MSEEDPKEKAIAAREKKYGYRRGTNASLTKPKEYEDLPESQFADPVGYNYPIDKEHIRAAITYWARMENRKAYSDPKARAFITERIVRAALANGIEVSWQADDPDYRKLPESLKRRMAGYEEDEAKRKEEDLKAAVAQEILEAWDKYSRGEL
jgi:hypothetical protein